MYDPSLLYLDPILTGFSVGYQDQQLYGQFIMPDVPVRTQSGKYLVWDRSNWVIFPSRREPGTVANEIRGRKWSYDTFFTKEHSLQSPIHDEERQQLQSLGGFADPVMGGPLQIDPERDATELVTRSILLEKEYKISTLVRNTANYPAGHTVTLSGAQQWNDYTNGTSSTSNPVNDIQVGLQAVKADTGRDANTMVMPSMGLPYVANHPRVQTRFQYFSLTDQQAWLQLAGFTGRLILVDDVYNQANNIDATESIAYFWGRDVWLGVVDPSPTLLTKTFGKTFAQIYPDGTTKPTERWREEPRKSDLVRSSHKYDLKIVSGAAGYLIKNAFATTAFPG